MKKYSGWAIVLVFAVIGISQFYMGTKAVTYQIIGLVVIQPDNPKLLTRDAPNLLHPIPCVPFSGLRPTDERTMLTGLSIPDTLELQAMLMTF